jgi:hypothetical protein
MPIPDLNEHGVLPAGIHDCTYAELEGKFGQDQWVQDPDADARREILGRHPFDVFVVAQAAKAYDVALRFFQGVRGSSNLTKGLLRVKP